MNFIKIPQLSKSVDKIKTINKQVQQSLNQSIKSTSGCKTCGKKITKL